MKAPIAIATGVLLMSNAADAAQTRPAVEHLPRSTLNGQPLPFSSAVRVGDVLYLSGQMGFRENGTLAEGMEGQARQALENIRAVLKSAGLGFGDVFHCTVMLADMKQWPAFNKVYLEYFKEPLPARSAFGANGLALGGLVELECQAYAGSK
jgi:2-iminobutanoate/2-iminopropanoate deaminase